MRVPSISVSDSEGREDGGSRYLLLVPRQAEGVGGRQHGRLVIQVVHLQHEAGTRRPGTVCGAGQDRVSHGFALDNTGSVIALHWTRQGQSRLCTGQDRVRHGLALVATARDTDLPSLTSLPWLVTSKPPTLIGEVRFPSVSL